MTPTTPVKGRLKWMIRSLAFAGIACSFSVLANPEAPGMYDAKNQGMGGAGVAHLDTPAAIFHNPANLAFTEDAQYQGNFTNLLVQLGGSFSGADHYQQTDWLPVPLPFLGFTERLTSKLVTGGAFYFSLGFGGGYENIHRFGTGQPCTKDLAGVLTEGEGAITLNASAQDNDLCLDKGREEYVALAIFEVAAPLSYQLTPTLNLGVALRFPFGIFEQKTTQDIVGAFTARSTPVGSYGLGFTQVRSDMSGYGKPGFLLGINYEVLPFLRLAATYRSKVTVTLTGESDMILESNPLIGAGLDAFGDLPLGALADLLAAIPEIGPLLQASPNTRLSDFANQLASDIDSELNWSIPKAIEFGVALDATPSLLLAIDWRHQYHSDANREFVVKLKEPLFRTTGLSELGQPLAWKDVYMLSIGAQYQYNDQLDFRLGYSRGNSATPDAFSNPFTPPPGDEQSSWYLGLGVQNGGWEYDIGLNIAKVQNKIPQPYNSDGSPTYTENCRPGQLVKSGCPGKQTATSIFIGLSVNRRY